MTKATGVKLGVEIYKNCSCGSIASEFETGGM
jgi:hypothetical protein